jgi:hypothetical protein
VLSFGGVAVGGKASGIATFKNVGGAALTINAVHLPAAPFFATGAPAPGTEIPAGGSLTVNVNFEPTAEGSFSDEISMETTGGDGGVGLTGTASAPGHLSISSEQIGYGEVEVGSSASRSFTITNTGGTNVTITKSKPPSGGEFAATTTLAEGSVIAPGEKVTESVSFAPTVTGPASGTWAINGDDTTGLHEVTFTGTGKPAAATATFGKTSVGGSSDRFLSERKRVNRYALSTAGSVTKLSLYLAPTETSGQEVLKGLIYSDSGGAPSSLLGVSEQLTYKSTEGAGWHDLTFATPVKLAAGNYWIGVITGQTAGVAGFRFDSVASSRDYNANTYASGPTNPFGSVTVDAEQTSLYATYTPG